MIRGKLKTLKEKIDAKFEAEADKKIKEVEPKKNRSKKIKVKTKKV